jgi:exodeoxyribonuclease V alpha subunit
MTELIRQFRQQGLLSSLDRQLAIRLGRLSSETDESVLLAAALASRAPRHGHICVEIQSVSQRLVPDEAETELPWPDPPIWLDALRRSPLVRDRSSTLTTPLVLDRDRLYLDRYWRYQQRLADQLATRASQFTELSDKSRLRAGLDRLFTSDASHGLDRQRLAALVASVRSLTLITGGPGTGKTTTVAALLALLVDQHAAKDMERPLRIALAAPTGKAADRVAESITEGLSRLPLLEAEKTALSDLKALTLHKLLGWQPRSPTRFRHHSENPLPHDVVVVDEASMVDLPMMSKLVDAIRPEARLILLGDPDQLASVEAGAVLGDLCAGLELDRPRLSRDFAARLRDLGGVDPEPHCEIWDSPGIWDAIVQLNRTWRFGMDTSIGRLSVAIRQGDSLKAMNELEHGVDGAVDRIEPPEDSEAFENPIPAGLLGTILAAITPAVQAALEGKPREALEQLSALRVLAAHRKGPLGLTALNTQIARALAEQIPGLNPGSGPWLGQPILIRENDSHLDLRNGQVGILIRGAEGSQGLVAAFREGTHGLRRIGVRRLPRYESMLCMTIHQSQGSQFEHAVLVLPSRSSPILTRELLYTGITRAQKKVSILSSTSILCEAIDGQVQRASGLEAELWHNP